MTTITFHSAQGRLDGFAVRVPTINVSFVDLTFMAERATSIEEINAILIEHAKKGKRVVRLKGGNRPVFTSPLFVRT